jgi:hypothetical protein
LLGAGEAGYGVAGVAGVGELVAGAIHVRDGDAALDILAEVDLVLADAAREGELAGVVWVADDVRGGGVDRAVGVQAGEEARRVGAGRAWVALVALLAGVALGVLGAAVALGVLAAAIALGTLRPLRAQRSRGSALVPIERDLVVPGGLAVLVTYAARIRSGGDSSRRRAGRAR